MNGNAKEGDVVTRLGWANDYLQQHPEADTTIPIGFVDKNLEAWERMAIAFPKVVNEYHL